MSLTDQDFRDQFKPLHIPAHYDGNDTIENRMVFALAEINEGTVTDVISKLKTLDSSLNEKQLFEITNNYLKTQFDKGLIRGREIDGELHYDLSKVTLENSGKVNPRKLAPGLD